MTTRSGNSYKRATAMSLSESREESATLGVTELLRMMREDRERHERERQLQEERRVAEQESREQERQLQEERRVAEQESREQERQLQEERRVAEQERREQERQLQEERRVAEQERREREQQTQMEMMREQVRAMQTLMEGSRLREESYGRALRDPLKLTKLSESEDIEAFLTTFERMMQVYNIEEERWAFKLAPQLTGKAQQAYAAMAADRAADYQGVKAAILKRYNITEETYRKRFRDAQRKTGESYGELVVRLGDLVKRWMADCDTVEKMLDKLLIEQTVSTMPTGLRIWVAERKPATSEEAGKLADSYLQARQNEAISRGPGEQKKSTSDRRKCRECGKEGHFAKDCPSRTDGPSTKGDCKEAPRPWKTEQKRKVQCFNCHKLGHFAAECPEKGLFCGEQGVYSVTRKGVVDGTSVEDIVLDTGCSRTMVHQRLVKESQYLDGEAVTIRCAHGDTVLYPLAEIEVVLDEVPVTVQAAVAERLPASMLLGTDVPQLGKLLLGKPRAEEVLMVKTRAQTRKESAEEQDRVAKQRECGVKAKPLEEVMPRETSSVVSIEVSNTECDSEMPGQIFAEDLFYQGKRDKPKQTRKQKREERARHGVVRAKDKPQRTQSGQRAWDFGDTEELRRLQRADKTLEAVREEAAGRTDEVDGGLYERDGIIYRRWRPVGEISDQPIDQIVLPKEYRKKVLHIAHTIPLGGHLGKKKTSRRIQNRFYWPTLFRDVADYCQGCEECQKCTRRRGSRAPLISMPVMGNPFERIAMDIIGPLPRSRSGNRYVLVVCDYGTRYPEAVPLKSIEAEKIAEELVMLFARVGIPKEILTDQGSNFTSQLLAELYRLLKVKALRTSPYHPQTDGLVERFNQTLKEMLRKSAREDGKDWDKLIPYVLFAYREVPQESTGYSPFELMYGREVRGPLDVLKESWESSEKSEESVLSYILLMRERLAKMTDLVQTNLAKAQAKQKTSYDRGTREQHFAAGDQVLVLLPTTTSKLTARWQGPYEVVQPVGKVNYLVNLHDKRRRKRVLHVNMLKEWRVPKHSGYLTQETHPEEEDEIPGWNDEGGKVHLGENLTGEQKQELEQLIERYKDVLSSIPGKTSLTDHHIETGEARPVRLPPYRLPQAYREIVQGELKEMLDYGIIEHSKSDWAFPVVIVPKKDGTLRLCVDYRRLNAVSKVDAYPMPRIEELVDNLGKAKYISTLDLTRGYWQVPVIEKDRPKTAFATPFGLFQFRRMPFGLQGAPATFQRMVDKLLDGLGDFTNAYLDDLIIYSQGWTEHLQHVEDVLKRLKQAGLKAKPKKCHLGNTQCTYLGYIVGEGKVKPETTKVEAVKRFERPRTKKEVRTFLGMTGYYRKFIPQYSTLALALTDLTKKSGPTTVVWTADCEESFQKLKHSLCTSPILHSPDFSKEFILQTDASERGVGAVLSQQDDNGADYPIAYFSRKLLPREERYSTIEKECLAIKLAIQNFRTYLVGRRFLIQTDHRSLEWLDRIKENNARLTRWSLFLQPYQYSVQYRQGKRNGNADALSRAQ